MSDIRLRDIYRGLSRIEDTFKVTKSELSSRPVYVWTNEHIDAHFSTCFTALVLIRLLEEELGRKYPVGRILESLRKYSCIQMDANTYKFVYFDEIMKECGKLIGTDLSCKYHTQMEMRRMLHY